jgi:hypothetical protein
MRPRSIGVLVILAMAFVGCGSSTTTSTSTVASGVVTVVVISPTSGSVIAGTSVVVRGTVTPANATVQIQGQPAAVGNGVFTGTASLHAGKTTIDVIGSAPGAAPGSTSITITQQSNGGSGKPPQKSKGTNPGRPPESNKSSCGPALSVGPSTTCVFAEAVESAYRSSGGSGTVEAYSPVTQKFYEMTCVTTASIVTCTGGIGASVYFPP